MPAGVAALGSNGKYLVAGLALAEFFGGSCMMLIVEWRILAELLPMESESPSRSTAACTLQQLKRQLQQAGHLRSQRMLLPSCLVQHLALMDREPLMCDSTVNSCLPHSK